MPWPRGRSTTWAETKSDDEPCPYGDVGEFTRGVARNGARFRKCRACQRRRMKRKRSARILAELAA